MKLLKVVLITCIFLQAAYISVSKNIVRSKIRYSVTDTIQHLKKTQRKFHYPPPPRAPSALEETYDDCVFTNRYTISQRLKRYPFSKAVKIIVLSYPLQDMEPEIIYKTDSADHVQADTSDKGYDSVKTGLHIKNGVLNVSSLKEVKTLNTRQINNLTNILYNTTYRRKSVIMVADPGGKCFNPRNAILFYDKNGKIFDYLVVCFECQHYESLSDKISVGTYCNQKYDLLKKFFIDAGIKYGTINTK